MRTGELPDGVRGVDLGASPPASMTAVTVADAPLSPTERGAYRVTVVFRHPVQAAGFDAHLLKDLPAMGDSGLRVPAGPSRFVIEDDQVEGREFRIAFEANKYGRLGRVVSELTVDGAPLARRVVTSHLGAILARLAFENDSLVEFQSIETVDVATGKAERGFTQRGEDVVLEAWPAWAHHESAFFRNAYAAYREALVSTDPYWAVLCFIRLIEGVRVWRTRAMALASQRHLPLTRPDLVLVPDPLIVEPYREWVGKKASWVADKLHHDYRLPLAHGVTPDNPMLASDQLGVEGRHWAVRPVAHQIARRLLQDARDIRALFGDGQVPEVDDVSFA
jgi:hypothetical protein